MIAYPSMVHCADLHKDYGNFTAIRSLNLDLPAGRVIGLLGPNGSGKTTLLKILAGLLQPTSGEVAICGVPVGPQSKAIVSYMPDRIFYANWMRTEDLLQLFQDFYADFRMDRAKHMCQTLSIDMKAKIKNMSKGTQEKLQLIVTMSRRAQLYLLDEPIAGVDPAAREFILNTIMSNCEPDSTVLISTHLLADVEPILHEAIFLRTGEVVCYDTVERLRAQTGKSLDHLFREIFRMWQGNGGNWQC
ncbi:MAG: ABC transporter ATP-binding protein [Oscillospiraceae bacterium]|nr:ABC transporter ATP-binding protein [Oscillospiraceae bacterium]